ETVRDGRAAVTTYAPKAADALDQLEATVWRVIDADLVDAAAQVCAAVHGYPPLPRPAELGHRRWAGRDAARWRSFDDVDDATRVALAFAEQFSTDVAAITDEQRDALRQALGEGALPFAHALYVVDVVPRAQLALDRLFGPGEVVAPRLSDGAEPDLWGA